MAGVCKIVSGDITSSYPLYLGYPTTNRCFQCSRGTTLALEEKQRFLTSRDVGGKERKEGEGKRGSTQGGCEEEEERATTISPHNRVTAAKEEERGVFATVEADRSAGHSNTEFPVWHFTKPFEQDGA